MSTYGNGRSESELNLTGASQSNGVSS